jgi:cysteine synthase B
MSVLDAIGNTPLVSVDTINPNPRVRLMAKLEGNNPAGSVKDRIALHMIRVALERGELTRGKTILEATSGNTGIGLAMVGTALGYKVKLTMPGCVSVERRRVLEAFGAELVLSDSCQGTDGAIMLARKIFEDSPDDYYMPNQFENPANPEAHYLTTGPEIVRQTGGAVTHFVAGMGTTGTLMGVARSLREHHPSVKIVGVEPKPHHTIQGLKNMTEAIVPPVYRPEALDEIFSIEDDDAFAMTRSLALDEGLFVGMSSGAAMFAARRLAEKLDRGCVVTLLPDRGDRYLSTNLFTSVCAKCPP